jgi:hypothetical protein
MRSWGDGPTCSPTNFLSNLYKKVAQNYFSLL